MALNLRKSEEDKRFETRSKIRNYKTEVERGIKKQQQLLAQAISLRGVEKVTKAEMDSALELVRNVKRRME